MKTAVMYDSTDASDIPKRARAVLAYVDGKWPTVEAVRQRFPKAAVVTITTGTTPAVRVLDREAGDVPAALAARWARAEHRAKRRPTIYANLNSMLNVCRALAKHQLQRDVDILTAHWTGTAHICDDKCLAPLRLPFRPKIIGTQYADPTTSGGHYDLSLVDARWLGDKPHPSPLRRALRRALRIIRRALRRTP